MNDPKYYIELIKEVNEVETDSAVAELLGLTGPTVYQLKRGDTTFDTDLCLDVADLTGVSVLEILIHMKAFKAHKRGKAEALKRWNKEIQDMVYI